MPTSRKRLTFMPDLDSLTVLGYSIAEDTPNVCGTGPAKRLAHLVERASRDLTTVLSRSEWNAIADAMNGTAELYDYAGSAVPSLLMVRANLEDSPGIGQKWSIRLPDLLAKLESLTPVHGEAILAAVRWAWRNAELWDRATSEWWLPAFRRDNTPVSE